MMKRNILVVLISIFLVDTIAANGRTENQIKYSSHWTCLVTRLVTKQVLRFFRLKPSFSLTKSHFEAEFVQ
jgi:hypothetical protein